MYLSRLELDLKKRDTMKALVSPNIFHGAVETAFSGEKTRKLWRIDNIGQHYYLLLLSEEEPNLEQAVKQFGIAGNEKDWETKNYNVLLDRIEENTNWHFRLTANPTKSIPSQNKRGRIHAHITPFYQKKWLIERSKKNGFTLDEKSFEVIESRWQRFYKRGNNGKQVTILSVTYEGELTVIDEHKFKNALIEGIGRGKAFGMGMLSVVRHGRN